MTDVFYEQQRTSNFPKPDQETLLTTGWNNIQKGKINWPDFNNLLCFYCLELLKKHKKDQFSEQTLQQANKDEQELRNAIEALPELKGSKPETVEQRLNAPNENLKIGKKWINALVFYYTAMLSELEQQMRKQKNDFRRRTLLGIKIRALQTCNCLRQRYHLRNPKDEREV